MKKYKTEIDEIFMNSEYGEELEQTNKELEQIEKELKIKKNNRNHRKPYP